MRTNHNVSAVSVGNFVEEVFCVFVKSCSSVRERHKISIRSHKLHYLNVNFSLDAKENGREYVHIYGIEGE